MVAVVSAAVAVSMSLGEARVKEEPGYEVTDQECVKLEPFCADSAGSCSASEAAILAGLYADHVVKDELVFGPECVQHPPTCGDSTGVCVSEAAILYTEHVVKDELAQRGVHATSPELMNVLDFERNVPCVPASPAAAQAQPRADTFLEDTAYVAPHPTDDAGTSQPCELSVSRVYSQCDMTEELSTLNKELFLSEAENVELSKNKPSILEQLKGSDEKFIEYFRLSQEQFVKVLKLIESDIKGMPCSKYPKAEMLAVTLRYLATGENLQFLSFQHRIYYPNLSQILKITFQAICKHLKPIYLPQLTEERLANVAKRFLSKWNLPNCCGALEGKHCRVLCGETSQSLLPNYELPSVVLIGLVDADGKFIRVDIGLYGRVEDSGIFSKSELGRQIESGGFPFPADAILPGSDVCFPHFVVGGAGYKLVPQLMGPFLYTRDDVSKLYYNERLSFARSPAESAFGALTNTFRVFNHIIKLETETVQYLILASCCLHNMLMENGHSFNSNSNNVSQSNLISLRSTGTSNRYSKTRNELKDYLSLHKGRDLTKLQNWQSVEENPKPRDVKISYRKSLIPAIHVKKSS